MSVAERHEDISQPQGGWYCGVIRSCPEGTLEREPGSSVPLGRRRFRIPPANLHRRCATKRCFLKCETVSYSCIQLPISTLYILNRLFLLSPSSKNPSFRLFLQKFRIPTIRTATLCSENITVSFSAKVNHDKNVAMKENRSPRTNVGQASRLSPRATRRNGRFQAIPTNADLKKIIC